MSKIEMSLQNNIKGLVPWAHQVEIHRKALRDKEWELKLATQAVEEERKKYESAWERYAQCFRQCAHQHQTEGKN